MIRRKLTGAVDEKLKFKERYAQTLLVSTVLIHLSAAPTTSETLKISYGAEDQPEFETVLKSVDPSDDSQTDITFYFSEALPIQRDEYIKVEYLNTDNATLGITVKGVYC